MSAPAPVEAVFFDGHSARRHMLRVRPTDDGAGLALLAEGAEAEVVWPLSHVRRLPGEADRGMLTLTLHHDTGDETPRDPARLVLGDAQMIAWVLAYAPALDRRDLRRGTARRVVTRLAAAAAAFCVLFFVLLPRLALFLADRIPPETEVVLGQSVKQQIEWLLTVDGEQRALTCTGAEGAEALAIMRDRLTIGLDLPYPVDLVVFDHAMVNAFAAPGGHVVILRGLLDEAETPEEVAGVLAHELGHVAARDPLRAAMRSAGTAGLLSIVLGDFTGAALIAVMGEHVMNAAYSREAETAADGFAHDLLRTAQVDIAGLADFFDRLDRDGTGLPEYIATHPQTAGRADAARGEASDQGVTRPVLSGAEWMALRSICEG
ncbi:M48 family metallopeptidase [Aliigemmobacter aestuarii]|uniref:M48 family metallopeptidase n=1 Tax=Aliigemmobacter aestuarii TaxID=1445661 RepID=A0A4S3MUP2_9RHOB|nr:M48 family metallopeptidase [Gemmobacter aestuarii]THD85261.1 M48 family metallopeptidase [Gemmobacter aestuarii]